MNSRSTLQILSTEGLETGSLEELQKIIEEDLGEKLTLEQTEELGRSLINLYEALSS